MIIRESTLCNQKMESLKKGQNAFAESEKLIHLIEQEVAKEKLDVLFERTPAGCWFIPTKRNEEIKK